jgi:hypothetical protein
MPGPIPGPLSRCWDSRDRPGIAGIDPGLLLVSRVVRGGVQCRVSSLPVGWACPHGLQCPSSPLQGLLCRPVPAAAAHGAPAPPVRPPWRRCALRAMRQRRRRSERASRFVPWCASRRVPSGHTLSRRAFAMYDGPDRKRILRKGEGGLLYFFDVWTVGGPYKMA